MTIDKKVIHKIKQEKITSYSKGQLLRRAFLFWLGIILLFLTVVIFSGWLIIVWHFGGLASLSWVGSWVLLVLSFGFLIILEEMIKEFSWAYRRPLIYSFIILLFLAFGFAMLWAKPCFYRNRACLGIRPAKELIRRKARRRAIERRLRPRGDYFRQMKYLK